MASKFKTENDYGKATIEFLDGHKILLENVLVLAKGECEFTLIAHASDDNPMRCPVQIFNKLGEEQWVPSDWLYERKDFVKGIFGYY